MPGGVDEGGAIERSDARGPSGWSSTATLVLWVTLLLMGFATNWFISLVGAVVLVVSLGGWIAQLLPGRGHVHESFVEPARRARPAAGTLGQVSHLQPGMPGYRFNLPLKVHPISAGIKGGIVGGLVMPIPAFIYGVMSGRGVWFPINLLAGIALPGVDELPLEQACAFREQDAQIGRIRLRKGSGRQTQPQQDGGSKDSHRRPV